MSYEDLITIKAFLVALKSLDQPLPAELQTDLDAIAATLPTSAYELHDLAERYEPLHEQYLAALQTFPGEGERLKFINSKIELEKIELENVTEPETGLTEVDILIRQLHHQFEQGHRPKSRSPLLIKDLGWSSTQAIAARSRLQSFEDDWNAPGMELYDDL